jgi:hypothetical protein
MKKTVLIAALLAAVVVQPVLAAKRHAAKSCPPASAQEAEQGLRFMTDLMIVSSMCKDTVYAEFRLRNRDLIIRYQKAMITHLHGKSAFDHWDTALANQAAQRQAGNQQVCQQQAALLQQAKAMDSNGFHTYAEKQAHSTAPASCAR